MTDFEKSIMDFVQKSSSEESWGVAQVLLDMHRSDKEDIEKALEAAEKAHKDRRITMIFCIIAVIAFTLTSIVFGVLASGIQIDAQTTTTTVEQDTGEGGGDAVYQSGENAHFYAGGDN